MRRSALLPALLGMLAAGGLILLLFAPRLLRPHVDAGSGATAFEHPALAALLAPRVDPRRGIRYWKDVAAQRPEVYAAASARCAAFRFDNAPPNCLPVLLLLETNALAAAVQAQGELQSHLRRPAPLQPSPTATAPGVSR